MEKTACLSVFVLEVRATLRRASVCVRQAKKGEDCQQGGKRRLYTSNL